ncbi:MAG: hypothetical protein P8Z37_11895 [Acidobacteriota bacterium]
MHASSDFLPIITDPVGMEVEIRTETPDLETGEEITVFITPSHNLGKGYRAEDIDVGTLTCNGTTAVSARVRDNTLVANFSKQTLGNPSTAGSVKFYVSATFNIGGLKNIVPADEAAFTVTLFAEQKGKGDGGSNAVPVAIEGSDKVKIPER